VAPGRLVRDYVALHHASRLERAFAGLMPDFDSLEIAIAPDTRPAAAKRAVPSQSAIAASVARESARRPVGSPAVGRVPGF